MKHKINFYYSSDTSNGDKVNILESTKEMLKNFGEPGTWENLTELINNIKKKSNTNSEEYEEFKPKVLFGEGLNLDSTLDTMKNSIVETLNAIYDYLEKADEIDIPDQISGGNNGGYSGGGAATTTTGNTGNEKIPDGSPSPEAVIPIVTGDNPESAAEIARRAGIDNADKYISLDGMSLEDVRRIVREYRIFGRVTPEQKEVIIESLKDDGHTVAMTGDGVNDILALRVADCSIAMASGSDAAKNVSHLVSLDSSFSALPDVVREGRRVINNLQRTVSVFLIKTVFAIVLTIFFLCRMFKLSPSYPFEPVNMYIWEIPSIGIGSLFLSLQPNEERIKSKFLMNIVFRLIPAATVQIGLVMFFFWFCKDFETAKTMSILAFSIFSFVILIRVCMPFDVYRAILVPGLIFIGGMWMVADGFIQNSNYKLGISYELVTTKLWIILAAAIFVGILVYAGLSVGVSKFHKYLDKKREEKRYDHF